MDRLAALGGHRRRIRGVLLITRPGFHGIHPAALLSLAATICYGFYAVMTRIVSRVDSNQTSLFYNNGSAPGDAADRAFCLDDAGALDQVALMLMTGVLGSLGHFLLISGHRLAPASVLSPFIYTQLIWVVILGYVVFDHVPNVWTMAGASMVVGSGLYMIWRERKLGRSTTSEGVLEGPRD